LSLEQLSAVGQLFPNYAWIFFRSQAMFLPRSLSRNRRGLTGFEPGYGSFFDHPVLQRL
jgi:hypothetical protein